ncbi:MAG: site-specific integrase, partial [Planctomycetes bacterium]|nr:site-specific integrase [Planctomycetota bacterium]
RTRELLAWWRDQSPYNELEHFIFFGRDGSTHLNAKTIGRKIPPAMVRAGIEIGDRWLSAHSLRHTYNTRLQKLLPEAMLRYMIGHKSRAMTKRYTHITPEERLVELQSALEQIDTAWE